MKSIINILTKRPSLESEFAVESSIAELHKIKDIDELRELASVLARANNVQPARHDKLSSKKKI